MSPLLIVGGVIIAIALLGFIGVVRALRNAAWLVLVIGIVLLILGFVF